MPLPLNITKLLPPCLLSHPRRISNIRGVGTRDHLWFLIRIAGQVADARAWQRVAAARDAAANTGVHRSNRNRRARRVEVGRGALCSAWLQSDWREAVLLGE